MTTYYVGIGGDDGADGTSWANRKLTLNGAENIPVSAGDTVYVGPGTYRELLTVDVSGSAGNPITYIGDYLGTNTNGVGGVVRVTGSADDIALTRGNCITATSKNYRTFQGFAFDGCSSYLVSLITACSNWIIQNNHLFVSAAQRAISVQGTGTNNTIQDCYMVGGNTSVINFGHTSTVSDAGHIVQNCIVIGGSPGISFTRVGGCTVKNNTLIWSSVQVITALAAGQTETVANNIFINGGAAISATAVGEITENPNSIIGFTTPRVNTNTGANSVAYLAMLDTRWFFNNVYKSYAQKFVTPFDLAQDAKLLDFAGTSPTTTDLRGNGEVGAERELGALECDPGIEHLARRGAMIGGGLIGE